MMIPIVVEKIAEVINGRIFIGDGASSVTGVSIDSRTIREGDIFFAIRGGNFDGHDYARTAIEKGASCVVLEHEIEDLPSESGAGMILAGNTIDALGKLAGWYRQQLSAKVIAITGSAGKTTTRQMLYQVLSEFCRCRQAPKSFNNNIGVPLTILSAEPDDEMLLLELGSNRPGEIAELTDMSKPDAAVITFVGPAHLEGFRTLENVLNEKVSIVKGLKQDGTLYMNGDQSELAVKAKAMFDGRIITFGTNQSCDVIGTDFQLDGNNSSLVVEGQRIDVPLAGKANLMNVLTVWSVCKDLKVSLSDYIDVIGRLKPVSMRLEVLHVGLLTILNDCYNANPASMANALECLKTFRRDKKGRLVFIAGTMKELGSQSAVLHTELGHKAAKEGIELLLCVGPFAENTAAGALQHCETMQVQTFENTELLCNNLHKSIQPDDIVLVKGSRAVGLEKAVEVILKCKV
ncbi:MAG: UDP-N-acetylmuramoyl-tripeptide--D-alanyl-D-alanine ligase [Phycisphaerae bacterium]|nr:UDP-N-acetylmuramoyl-tripeptide--D-alanyl-D-alanine ligase [Phycisphaerae bacterium]